MLIPYYLCLLIGLVVTAFSLKSLYEFIHRHFIRKGHDLPARYGKDSWALVTGASTGIGLAFCKELGKQGFNVIMVGRKRVVLERAKVEVDLDSGDKKIKTLLFDLDCNSEDPVKYYEGLVNQVKDLDISIVVNNAGCDFSAEFVNIGLDQTKKIFDANVYAPTILTKLFAHKLKDRKHRGAIINVASIVGVAPMPYYAPYGASKVLMRFLTLGLHDE